MSADFSELRSALEDWAEEVHRAAFDEFADESVDQAPVGSGDREGVALRDSQERVRFDGLTAELAFTAEHASWTDEGTAPHRIDGNPLLAFEVDGETVIVRFVDHPGTDGTQWWTNFVTDTNWAAYVQDAADSISLD